MKKLHFILGLLLVVALSLGSVSVVLADDPTVEPTKELTEELTEEPTVEATEEATEGPTEEPTVEVTEEATEEPTEEPTVEVTEEATEEPTEEPTVEVTEEATEEPTEEPTAEVTEEATEELPQERVVSSADVTAQALVYGSCFQLQNLSSSQANVVISYYAQGTATPVAEPSDTISAGSSKTYCPLPSSLGAGFNGSVVIESDQQLAAIANVAGDGGAFKAYDASYSGFTGGSTSVSLPLLMKNNYGYNTWFNVQNVGTSNATVTVSYSDGKSAGPKTVGPGQAVTFNQSAETHTATVFAATVTSSGADIVATVMEVGPAGSPMLFAYNGFSDSSTNPVMPLVSANNFGFTTGIQVQNTGASASTVTIRYAPTTAGTACTETKTIQAGKSQTFALHAWDSTDPDSGSNTCVNGQTFVGSAKVTANSSSVGLVAIVNQQNFSTHKGAAYSAFDPGAATNTVVMPLIMDRNYGYFTGFNIQNVGSSSTNVRCTFSGSGVTVPSTAVPAGGALTHVQLNAIGNGYVGSATCTASGGTHNKIVGVVNELLNAGSQDTFLVYEATSK